MRQIFVFIILFFFHSISSDIYSKNNVQYFQKIADSLYNNKEYKIAAIYYDSILLKTKKPTEDFYYNAACVNSLAQNLDKSFSFLNKTVDIGYLDLEYLNSDLDLLNCRNDIRWKELVDRIKFNISKLDTSLVKELSEMHLQDQSVRQKLYEFEKLQNKDSLEFSNLISKMILIDSVNLIKIENIIQKYGWPGISRVGKNGNNTVWLIIQHNAQVQEIYYPLLKISVRKGESSKSDLAYLEDRINIFTKKKKQKYGTQYSFNKTTKKYELSPLKFSIKKTNRLRTKLGLNSIEENSKRFQ